MSKARSPKAIHASPTMPAAIPSHPYLLALIGPILAPATVRLIDTWPFRHSPIPLSSKGY
jgi:hypothetical protein